MAIVTNTFQVNGSCGLVTVVYYDSSGPKSEECNSGGTYVVFTYDNDYQGQDFIGGGGGGPVCCDNSGTTGCGSGLICGGCSLTYVPPTGPSITWDTVPTSANNGASIFIKAVSTSPTNSIQQTNLYWSYDNATWGSGFARDGADPSPHTISNTITYGLNNVDKGTKKIYLKAEVIDNVGTATIYNSVDITVDSPTVVWQPGTVPATVGSGTTYRPSANGNSTSGRLTTVLIDFSTDNSTWTSWAHQGFASTTSHTNGGNNSNSAPGIGNTKQYWRTTAGDDFGQSSGYIYATVNINASPDIAWDASSNSNTTAVIGDTFYLKANGSDPDSDSWGYLVATQIFKGYDGLYEEWAASPRGVGIFPSAEQSITFNVAGTYSFFAQAVDAFGASALTPLRTVTVTYPTYSVVAQIGTDCASITLDGQTGTSQFTKTLPVGQYNISATGNAGKIFDYWTVVGNGSVAGGETGAILTVTGNISGVYATYKTVNYTVRTQIGFGAATVTLNGVTHNYSFDSILPPGSYAINTTGNPNTSFVGWSKTGACTIDNVSSKSTTLNVTGDCVVTATYTDTLYNVIARNSTGGLKVSVNYNDTGTTQQLIAGNYQLSAEPLTDYIFNGWTGNTSAITDPTAAGYNTTITVNGSNLDVTATFTDKLYTITGNVGSGGSSVIIDGTSGSKVLKNGRYTLVANAAPGYQFSNWSGNTGGVEDTNASSTYINVYRSNATVTANFTIIPTVVPPPTPPPTPSVTPEPTPTRTPPTTSPVVTPSVTPTASAGAPPVTPSVTPSVSVIPPTPTPTPTASLGFLAVYTPWTVAKTNEPIWVQSVYPASRGFTAYGINFGDGNGYQDFKSVPNADNFFFYTYTKPASGQTYYSANVKGTAGAGGQPRALSNRFYIKTLLPSYDVEAFYDPIVTTLELPYSREQVYIGSNEWVVKDVINASITKLYNNFIYLVNACHTLKFTNDLKLIEWATLGGNWLSASYWHTEIDGLNDDGSFTDYATTSATGFADGVIKNIKSYRFNATTAPDYYNYIVLTGSGNGDHIQLRTNNYENTLALSAASLGPNISNFNSISAIDVLDKDLYILDTDTVYRVAVDATASKPFTILNQVGGVSGTRLDNFAFNNPFKIKAYNEKVYVADRDNSCVKVYNTALSWLKTIYTDALSAYSIQNIEINRNNESVFILGQTFAPVAPVLTYLQSNNVTDTVTVYTIRFVHDGLRLADTTTTTLSSFALYGKVVGGQTYIPLTSAITLSANRVYPWLGNTQTLTYAAASGVKFDSFKVKALGPNGFNSDLSNSDPLPVNNNYHFNTPYKVFEYNYYSSLLNSFEVPNNYEVIGAEQNIQSVTNIVEMVIDPTGSFIYFVTNEYVYKYLTNGKAVNRLYTPSKSSLGQVEDIKAAFIDNRLNFFIATNTRVFKFVDIPEEIELFDINTVSSYFTPLSSILIQQDEFVQDWVYNKAILRLIKNFDILYKVVNSKFKIDLDSNGNILVTASDSFETAPLSGTDVQTSFALNQDFFVHSNEFVTSSVVNRTLQKLYTLQEQTLQLVAPRITKQTPEFTSNAIYALPCISVTPVV